MELYTPVLALAALAAVITDIRVEAKSGGRSGDWTRP